MRSRHRTLILRLRLLHLRSRLFFFLTILWRMILDFHRTLVREASPYRLSYPRTEGVSGCLRLHCELLSLEVDVACDLEDALDTACFVDGVVLQKSHAFHESVAELPWSKLWTLDSG